MPLVHYLYAAIQNRFAELRADSDRGDSPVPTAIIIAGLAVMALAILTAAAAAINGWNALIPGADQNPAT
ncbi:hypothetical protein [Plantactinospora sp. KBS50]|uniref:hypothetical protein n=1 Tax=Plantactinospora sp. KBS50 TaxID=2024580 RepID=UPI000BAB0288|nr:hypothetical protein [Plantactinospora sp. KBS50]ASW53102.1 hypothetical protein CIK06_01205 [Plantactinospora sp. KBS50]